MTEQHQQKNEARMQDFADYLEYSISSTLSHSEDNKKRNCWCDGIMPSAVGEPYAVVQYATSDKFAFIEARAWIGEGRKKGGPGAQKLYKMIIKVGKDFLLNLSGKGNLQECVPSTETDEWIYLDQDKEIIELQLS